VLDFAYHEPGGPAPAPGDLVGSGTRTVLVVGGEERPAAFALLPFRRLLAERKLSWRRRRSVKTAVARQRQSRRTLPRGRPSRGASGPPAARQLADDRHEHLYQVRQQSCGRPMCVITARCCGVLLPSRRTGSLQWVRLNVSCTATARTVTDPNTNTPYYVAFSCRSTRPSLPLGPI